MYAERKGWDLRAVEIRLAHERAQVRGPDGKKRFHDEIVSEIGLEGDLDEAQRRRLLDISERCRVHRTLHSDVTLRTVEMRSDPV